MKRRNIFLISLAIIISLPIFSLLLNPLHDSTDEIRDSFLSETPLGLDKNEVENILRKKINLDIHRGVNATPPGSVHDRVAADSYIEVYLGSHFSHAYIVFRTYVYAYWTFDKENVTIQRIFKDLLQIILETPEACRQTAGLKHDLL